MNILNEPSPILAAGLAEFLLLGLCDDCRVRLLREMPWTAVAAPGVVGQAPAFVAEEVSFASVRFRNIRAWDGAITGYGGLAWFYLFNEKLCTYGVHSGEAAFWNRTTGNGLRISASSPRKHASSKFMRSERDELVWSLSISDAAMNYRYDKANAECSLKLDVPGGAGPKEISIKSLN